MPIRWARVHGGPLIPLEMHGSPRGPVRYRVREFGSPWLVEPVDPRADVSAYADHRLECSAVSARDRQAIIDAALHRGDDDASAVLPGARTRQ